MSGRRWLAVAATAVAALVDRLPLAVAVPVITLEWQVRPLPLVFVEVAVVAVRTLLGAQAQLAILLPMEYGDAICFRRT